MVGNFTSPPWERPLRLDFCKLRKIYVKYLKNLPYRIIEFKFIVDGAYRCDGTLPMTVVDGIPNNLI